MGHARVNDEPAPDRRCLRAEAARDDALARLARAEQALAGARRDIAAAEARLWTIEHSTLWQATAPLRALAAGQGRGARALRRALQLLWWSASLQLPRRLRWWYGNRRTRLSAAQAAPPFALIETTPDPASFRVPSHEHPLVSVIIPCFGQVGFTLRCLASIAHHPPSVPIEVIVAEDASGDPDIALLRAVAGIRLIEQPANLGFLHNANEAASQARGAFLFFLNNDTQVLPDWLDTLVALLQRRPDAGAAGAKLIYPDGRLQEAGGILWDDASAWNFGRLDDPARPLYNYVREVDYVSGAALLVRSDLFADLGGFDPLFAPAYCEDSDLAMRIRARGLSMLYQPRAQVVHFEGISHGTDLAVGGKAGQLVNQRRLRERWAGVLAADHYPNGIHVLRAREHGRHRRCILVIDHYVPTPDRDAGSRTMLAFLRAFVAEGLLVKFWPANAAYSPLYTEALQDEGVEVLYGPDCADFTAWIAACGQDIDLVLLSRPETAEPFIAPVRLHTEARLCYYGHDLHYARMRMQGAATGDAALVALAASMEQRERAIWKRVDIALYPSREEAHAALLLEPAAAIGTVLPYAFDTFPESRRAVPGCTILFVAGFAHPPNEDAALWLATDILPLVQARVLQARLLIVGSHPTEKVRGLQGQTIEVHANVSAEALRAFYAEARLTVVPLRYGAGVKLKVVEALWQGVPLVTTPVGAQGCPGLDRIVAVQADAAAFADAACLLLSDDTAWEAACARQLAYAEQHFTVAALRRSLSVVLASCP